jgi:hypothetical protein
MSEKIEKMIAAYAREKKIADADLSGHDPRTLPSAHMRREEARGEVAKLMGEYTGYIRDAAICILVSGPRAHPATFAKIAAESCRAISVTPRDFYASLAKEIEPALGDRREFSGTHLGILVRALTERAKEMDLSNVAAPQIHEVAQVLDEDALVEHCRSIVRAADGDRICTKYIEGAVIQQALEIRYSASVVAVVLYGTDRAELEALGKQTFGGNCYPIELGTSDGAPEEAAVVEALKKVKEQVKSKRQQ